MFGGEDWREGLSEERQTQGTNSDKLKFAEGR